MALTLPHLCFLCDEYPPGKQGGIGSFVQTLGRKLAQRGHQVSVVGVYRRPDHLVEDDEGVKVRRLPATRFRGLGFLLTGARLRRELAEATAENPIRVLEGPENALALVARARPPIKIIRMQGGHHFFHATLRDRPRVWRSWIERRSFSRADHLCGVSRFVAEQTRRLLALGDLPVEIIPNPVDTERFRPMPEVSVDPGRLVFVGTLCEKKGIRQLMQAMVQIVARVPEAHLVACGRDSKDPATGRSYRATLEAGISPELRGRIDFLDHVENSQLPRQLAAAQVLVYPSHMEAHPVAWLEGMAMGKPVVASTAGPGPEVLTHGVHGLLCDPHDPHAIADSIIRLLRDPGLAGRLGAAARERALLEFSIDHLVVRNEEFYRRCLENHG